MAISAYVGLQGHGKSYGVVEHVIIPALKAKRVVFTNIPMNQELLQEDFGLTVHYFTIDDIKNNENWFEDVFIAGAIWVCDELWRLWPQGLRSTSANEKHLAFIAEHRHMVGDDGMSSEIIYVTQDLGLCSSFCRTTVETTYRTEKLVKVGATKKFRIDVYFGCVTGQAPPKSKLDRQIYGRFKKDIYKYYKSHTKSVNGVVGDETKTDNRSNVLSGMTWKIAPVILIVIGYFAYSSFTDVAQAYGQVEKVEPEVSPVVSPKTSVASVNDVSLDKPPVVPSFLSKASAIIIETSTSTYNGAVFRFRIEVDSSYSIMTIPDLMSLDYEVRPINECLVKIKGFDFNGYAMCKNDNDKSWAEETFKVSS
jgi:zona occludens toxin